MKNRTIKKKMTMKDKSTKEMIIDILSCRWPLTLKALHNEIKKRDNKGITYQAVHKAVNALVNDKIVMKDSAGYSLSLDWINDMKRNMDNIFAKYKNNKKEPELNQNMVRIEFEILDDLYKFILSNIEKGVFDYTNRRIGTCLFYHFWNWIAQSSTKKEYELLLSTAKQNKNYLISNKDTTFDRFVASYYENLGWKVLLGKEVTSKNFDIIVHGDSVIHIYLPEDLTKKLAQELGKIKDTDNMDYTKMQHIIYHHKTKIIVTISRDPALAKQLHNFAHNLMPPEKRYEAFYV